MLKVIIIVMLVNSFCGKSGEFTTFSRRDFPICKVDQRICFRYTVKFLQFYIQNFKTLTIYCSFTARLVWNLVGNHQDRFSHDAVQMELRFRREII